MSRNGYNHISDAVLTDVECEFSYRVSLMEALQSVEADSNYVVAIIEESEMSDN